MILFEREELSVRGRGAAARCHSGRGSGVRHGDARREVDRLGLIEMWKKRVAQQMRHVARGD